MWFASHIEQQGALPPHIISRMARVLWIVGFAITFLFYGALAIGFVVVTIRSGHFTLRRAMTAVELTVFLGFLWQGFRLIVLKKTD